MSADFEYWRAINLEGVLLPPEAIDWVMAVVWKELYLHYKTKVLVLFRGLPGMQKSTMAERMQQLVKGMNGCESRVHEADHYFEETLEGRKVYKFDRRELGAAHAFCKMNAFDSMLSGIKLVVVANTARKLQDLDYYKLKAQDFGYTTVIYDAFRHRMERFNLHHFKRDPETGRNALYHERWMCKLYDALARIGVHNLSYSQVLTMAKDYEFSEVVVEVVSCERK